MLPEVAYYYPEPYWLANEAAWIKSLLLFFDEIAVLVPRALRSTDLPQDPWLVEALTNRGLLRVLDPDTFVDEETGAAVSAAIDALAGAGVFDGLTDREPYPRFATSRAGYVHRTSRQMFHEMQVNLEARGLARTSADGVSIPMHPVVRTLYLTLLAQLARKRGSQLGLDLHPVTNGPAGLEHLLNAGPMPSRGQIIAFDLNTVSVDLSGVPLHEVLIYRRENRDSHRRYMAHLRTFALELSLLEGGDRERALTDRQADLRDEARDLERRAWAAWKRKKDVAGFAVGLTGAAWSVATHDPVPAALALLGAGLGMLPSQETGSAYSYLFRAKSHLR